MLSMPYYKHRQEQDKLMSAEDAMPMLKRQQANLEYPEIASKNELFNVDLLLNQNLREEFAAGVEFKADPEV